MLVENICLTLLSVFRWQLPDGVELTLSELREMAGRQQRQIDDHQQQLVAKEQRLKYLKQQVSRGTARDLSIGAPEAPEHQRG